MKTLVLGCGISGLTTATVLQEEGYQVTIWAKDLPPHTTSDVAAAIWYPYKAYPEEKVQLWGKRTYQVLCELTKESKSGVSLLHGWKYFHRPMGFPWWKPFAKDFTRHSRDKLSGDHLAAYEFSTPVADTSIYLPYLMRRFTEAGGTIQQKTIQSLAEPLEQAPYIVNCTGLGSSDLVKDHLLFPIRGQIVRTEPIAEQFYLQTDHPKGLIYVIPRTNDCILGGTSEPENTSLSLNKKTSQEIIDRCALLAPNIKNGKILSEAVGLRPGRKAIRLEVEGNVIHNYGHGGSGVTLSWGCAEEVLRLIKQMN